MVADGSFQAGQWLAIPAKDNSDEPDYPTTTTTPTPTTPTTPTTQVHKGSPQARIQDSTTGGGKAQFSTTGGARPLNLKISPKS